MKFFDVVSTGWSAGGGEVLVLIFHDGAAISGLSFDIGGAVLDSLEGRGTRRRVHALSSHVAEYFAGEPLDLLDLEGEIFPPLANPFRTGFSKKVFEVVRGIPRAATLTYGEVARAAGSRASRAVGNVLRQNPFPLLVPCHRVVAASGIGGFHGSRSGAWIELKQRLLDLERRSGKKF
ncbi:MAG: methylated-DNA--[protein]-cysteine S-methyltransferase [Promethearchaeota archaeon]